MMTEDENEIFDLENAAMQSAHTYWSTVLEPLAYQAIKDDERYKKPILQDYVAERFNGVVTGHTKGYKLGFKAGRELLRAELLNRREALIEVQQFLKNALAKVEHSLERLK